MVKTKSGRVIQGGAIGKASNANAAIAAADAD